MLAILAMMSVSGVAQIASQDSLHFDGGNARFAADARVSGCVHNETGIALHSARVEARDLGSGRLMAAAYTNENGAFELSGLPQGVYELVAVAGVNEAHQQVKLENRDTVVYFRIAIDAADADTL